MDIKHLHVHMMMSHPKVIASCPSVRILFVHTVNKGVDNVCTPPKCTQIECVTVEWHMGNDIMVSLSLVS